MELRQLRYFLALARTLNFTRAATESHIAQPPLSRQIKHLEEELGVPLIDRRSRQLALTPAGELVQRHALEILARIDRLVHDARALSETGRQTVRIGMETMILYGRFPELWRELRSSDPHLRIEVLEMPLDRQAAALKQGQIDIGCGRSRISDPALAQMIVREEPLFVALPVRHPLAAAAPASLRLRDLAEESVIVFLAGAQPDLPSAFHADFAEKDFRPKEVIEVGELQVALGLVAADGGICIVPAVVQRMRGRDVCYRQLDEPGWSSPVLMTWLRSNRPPMVSTIKELLDKIYTAAP
jgi:LysR family transcriptional regulator, benzoate and cis,cis-muconate-responsive activator of ben and cat genes